MKAENFIDTIRQVVVEDSIRSIQKNLRNPPGKSPALEIIELSQWFKGLIIQDQKMTIKLVRESIQTAVFGFLCVLDGVRAIENSELKGRLKLIYEKENEDIMLNDPNEVFLHDLL